MTERNVEYRGAGGDAIPISRAIHNIVEAITTSTLPEHCGLNTCVLAFIVSRAVPALDRMPHTSLPHKCNFASAHCHIWCALQTVHPLGATDIIVRRANAIATLARAKTALESHRKSVGVPTAASAFPDAPGAISSSTTSTDLSAVDSECSLYLRELISTHRCALLLQLSMM